MGSNWEVHFKPEEILVYLRKSRSDDPLLSVEEVLEKHWAILQDWISRNLDAPVPEENIYKEVVSGETIDGRPEVLKLLKRIESPRIKGILVVEVQRLSRGDLEDCGRLMKLLRYTSTMVITPMKIYDLADEYDRDGFERELKRGNEYLEYFKKIQKRGRLQSVKSGNYIGSVPPYGYDKVFVQDSNGRKKVPTLAINETQASVVRLVYDLYVNQNMGTVNICRKLDEMGITPPKGRNWSYHTVQDMLSNEHYTGKVVWNHRAAAKAVENMEVVTSRPRASEYLVFDGKHPAIIDDITFHKAQLLKKNGGRSCFKGREAKNIFSGILYCECGRSMNYRTYLQNTGHYSAARFQCPNQAVCDNGSVLSTELINAICHTLQQEIRNFEILAAQTSVEKVQAHEAYVEVLTKQLEALETKQISLWDRYAEDGMPKEIFEKLKEKCEKDIQTVKRSLEEAEKDTPDLSARSHVYTFRQALEALQDDTLPAATRNRFLKAAVRRITYSRPRPIRGKQTASAQRVHGWSNEEPKLMVELNL